MQTSLPAGMAQRLAYYVSNLYVSQLYEGNQYYELRPAISICILTEPMFPGASALHLDFRLKELSSDLILTDDLQIHLLQLNNLQATAENVYHATPAERWAYFLQNADKMSSADVRTLFPDVEISEAAGVLEMISQSPEQLMLYNARLKLQRDEVARILRARLEGEEIGEARGKACGLLIGRIILLQELLDLPLSTAEQFAGSDEAQLNEMAEQLQQQLRSRSS
jgi:predicted transposase/invertase (TIGR01784 family)